MRRTFSFRDHLRTPNKKRTMLSSALWMSRENPRSSQSAPQSSPQGNWRRFRGILLRMWRQLRMLSRMLSELLKELNRRIVAGRQPRMVFLLGAGFDIDANREAGSSHNDYSYPLVADVLKDCFGLDKTPEGKSVEDLFAGALQQRDYKPMEALVERLMGADYYIAQALATAEKSNSYRRFFEHFDGAQ